MGAYYLSWSRFITHPIDNMLPAIGIALGSFLGVYLIGNIGNKTGSFLATFGGSVLPASGCFAYGYLRGSFRDASIVVVWVFVATAVFFPSLCATIGFDLTRRYKNRLPCKAYPTWHTAGKVHKHKRYSWWVVSARKLSGCHLTLPMNTSS